MSGGFPEVHRSHRRAESSETCTPRPGAPALQPQAGLSVTRDSGSGEKSSRGAEGALVREAGGTKVCGTQRPEGDHSGHGDEDCFRRDCHHWKG